MAQGGSDPPEGLGDEALAIDGQQVGERAGSNPFGEMLVRHSVGDLVEDDRQELPRHLVINPEDLAGSLPEAETLGGSIEDEQAAHGEGGMETLEPHLGRTQDFPALVAGTEETKSALASLLENGVPVGLAFVGIVVVSSLADLDVGGHGPRIRTMPNKLDGGVRPRLLTRERGP